MLTSTVVPITNNQKSANLSQFEEIQNNKEQFFQWFVGFCDAEGHFIISIDNRGYVVFRFIICLQYLNGAPNITTNTPVPLLIYNVKKSMFLFN